MAPRRRRKIRPPPAAVDFNVGDLVLAKLRFHRRWPAKIVRAEDHGLDPKPGKYLAEFYGDGSVAFVSAKKLEHFTKETQIELQKVPQNRKFADAFKDICEALAKESAQCQDAYKMDGMGACGQVTVEASHTKSPEPMAVLMAKGNSNKDLTRRSNKAIENLVSKIRDMNVGSVFDFYAILMDAYDCSENGYAKEAIDFMVTMLETTSLGKKIKFLYLVQYLTWKAHQKRDIPSQIFLKEVENVLPRIVNAATPSGVSGRDIRTQCFKVLTIWRHGKIMSGDLLDKLIADVKSKCAQATRQVFRQLEGSAHSQDVHKGNCMGTCGIENLESKIRDMHSGSESEFYAIMMYAYDCSKNGYAKEAIDFMVTMLETASFGKKIKFLYLVEYLTRKAHQKGDIPSQIFLEEVENVLPRIVNAATPSGASGRDIMTKCLKVLAIWRQEKIMSGDLLDKLIADVKSKCAQATRQVFRQHGESAHCQDADKENGMGTCGEITVETSHTIAFEPKAVLISKANSKRDLTRGSNKATKNLESKIREMHSGSQSDFSAIMMDAYDCSKNGYAKEAIDFIVTMLETALFGKKIKFLYLVEYLTWKAHQKGDIPSQIFLEEVENVLPRIINAATPSGASGRDLRTKCLKVLTIWHQEKIMSRDILDKFIADVKTKCAQATGQVFCQHEGQQD